MKLAILAFLACGTAPAASVVAVHDYDPVTDSVVAWKLDPGESVTQSFTTAKETKALRGFRVRIRRHGSPPPVEYRVRSALRSGELLSGSMDLKHSNPWFERWYGPDFPRALPVESGATYYLELRVPKSSGGYYEVFGTSDREIANPRFLPRFRYEENWDPDPNAPKQFENPANIDYGAHTPVYREGSAYDGAGAALDGFDLAFEILGDGAAVPGARDGVCNRCEERFAFTEDITGPLYSKPVRDPAVRAKSDEVEVDGHWQVRNRLAADPVVQTAVDEFQKFLRTAMEAHAATAAGKRGVIQVATKAQLPEVGKGLSVPESFRLVVTDGEVLVCGFDSRGAMRGLHHVEALMKLKRAPILPLMDEIRAPKHSPRITSAPFYAKMEMDTPEDAYSDGLLGRMSRAGFNAIWLWGDLDEVAHSSVYPELDQGVRERQAKLRRLIARTSRYGIDVYMYLANRPLPDSFYQKHPGVRGSERRSYGGTHILCTSVSEVRQHLKAATTDLMKSAPGLKGIVFIVGGEGFMHCYTRKNTCPRCSRRTPQETIAGFSRSLVEGARAANPEAAVVLWPYSASNTWSRDDITQSELIRQLPPSITLMTEFGKEGEIRFGDIAIPAYDYPISFAGPSERFVKQAELAAARGMPFWVKTEHAIALEFVDTPYIPVFFQYATRFERIRSAPHLSGIFANWMHYGFMPSTAADVYYWHHWNTPADTEAVLGKLAERDYGAGASYAVNAWREFSSAIREYPFSSAMAMGPIQKGPSHPLFLDSRYRPLHDAGRQFKNDLSWTRPWGPALALSQLEKLEAGWARGVDLLRKAVEAAPERIRADAKRETGVAEALLFSIRSTIHVGRFYEARELLEKEGNFVRAAEALDRMAAIARAELDNAQAALPIVCADSRIGYANSGRNDQTGVPRAGIYSPGAVEKKILQLRKLLDEQIPAERERRGLR